MRAHKGTVAASSRFVVEGSTAIAPAPPLLPGATGNSQFIGATSSWIMFAASWARVGRSGFRPSIELKVSTMRKLVEEGRKRGRVTHQNVTFAAPLPVALFVEQSLSK